VLRCSFCGSVSETESTESLAFRFVEILEGSTFMEMSQHGEDRNARSCKTQDKQFV